MVIAGLPGAHEPTFLTRDRDLYSLDSLVVEVCRSLAEESLDISLRSAKACVQAGRVVVCEAPGEPFEAVVDQVHQLLRAARFLLVPALIDRILRTYAVLIAQLDVVAVT